MIKPFDGIAIARNVHSKFWQWLTLAFDSKKCKNCHKHYILFEILTEFNRGNLQIIYLQTQYMLSAI